MNLSIEDRAVLAHIVIDPDAWVAHALKTVGASAISAKINRYKAEYLSMSRAISYKARADRGEDDPANDYNSVFREEYNLILAQDQAVVDYLNAEIRLAQPILDPADYPDIEDMDGSMTTNPALIKDETERASAQAVIDNATVETLAIVEEKKVKAKEI